MANNQDENVQSLVNQIVGELGNPSDDVLNRVVAIFKRKQKRRTVPQRVQAELAFDSLTAGVRIGQRGGGSIRDRQLLFETESADLDLQIAADSKNDDKKPDEAQYTLHGQLLFHDSNDLMGIELHLDQLEANSHRVGLTDHLGRFTFTTVEPGSYTIQVFCDEHDIILEPIVVK